MALGLARSREEADKASSTCMRVQYYLAFNAIDGRDGEQVRLPRGLAGRFETAQMGQLDGKVDLAVWRRAARAVCQTLMTKFSCIALAAADITKPV